MRRFLAILILLALPTQASAAVYSTSAVGGSAESYADIVQFGSALLGYGDPSDGEKLFLQRIEGSPIQLSQRIENIYRGGAVPDYFPSPEGIGVADFDGDNVNDYAAFQNGLLTLSFSDRPDILIDYPDLPTFPYIPCSPLIQHGEDTINNTYVHSNGPAIGDINHDGLIDFTFTRNCMAYSYDEEGRVNPGWPKVGSLPYNDLILQDLNNDGLTDVLFSTDTDIIAMKGDGTEIWRKSLGAYTYNAAIGDVDGGGDLEIVVSSNGLHVYSLDGTEKFTAAHDNTTHPFRNVRLSDIDGDGKLDLITIKNPNGSGLTGSELWVYKLEGSATIMPGFPKVLGATSVERGVYTANLTKDNTGNEIIIPTTSGLKVFSRDGSELYTNAYVFNHMFLGTTNGTNFVAAGDGGSASAISFSVDGTPVTMSDQNDKSILARALNPRRTNTLENVPLRQGTPPPPLFIDFNQDAHVNVLDLSVILNHWKQSGTGDLDENGIVNVYDLSRLLKHWVP